MLLLIMRSMIANMRFATEEQINSWVTEKNWGKVDAAKASERVEANKKAINKVLTTLDKLLDLPEGVGIAATSNARAS